MTSELLIKPVTDVSDLRKIQLLAQEVWREHYPGIITEEQIEYMLERRHSLAALTQQYTENHTQFDIAYINESSEGYSAYEIQADTNILKIQSLYVKAKIRRTGCGQALLDRVLAYGKENACKSVILNVNRNNMTGIAAYHRLGFTIYDSVVIDIGGGFVMDDHLMERRL